MRAVRRDLNVILPRERLRELPDERVIAGPAWSHHAFVGTTSQLRLRRLAPEWARELRSRDVCLLVGT